MFHTSCLSIFKNETMNLKLWIEHYLWQGIEHFYLIDNGSDDNPLSILQEYIDNGIVTYYFLPEKHKQVEHYRYVFDTERLKEKTYWLIVCDLDEFFYGVDKKLTTKIKSLENYCFLTFILKSMYIIKCQKKYFTYVRMVVPVHICYVMH